MKEFLRERGFEAIGERFEPIEKGGSSRKFFRFRDERHGRCIACRYSEEKRENFLYAGIGKFLFDRNFFVPEVLLHDEDKRLIVMRDVGSIDLLEYARSGREGLLSKYYDVVGMVSDLHSRISSELKVSGIELCSKFDKGLYEWEQGYFFENCVNRYFGVDIVEPREEFEYIREVLLGDEEVVVHRDLQSQNIIVGEKIYLIDFQGMRFGSRWYDIGSLIYDPYVNLLASDRDKIFKRYCDENGIEGKEKIFAIASVERLMQALGAYGYLGIEKGKEEYFEYIPKALEYLIENSEKAGLKNIRKIAEICEGELDR